MDPFQDSPQKGLMDQQLANLDHFYYYSFRSIRQFQHKQQRLYRCLVAGVLVTLVYFLSISWKTGSPLPNYTQHDAQSPSNSSTLALVDVIRALYEPIKLEPTTPHWIDHEYDGKRFSLPENVSHPWTTTLGKKIAFIDIDTRPLDILQPHDFEWDKLTSSSTGVMNHYLYIIHGYDYHFIRTGLYGERSAPWTKPPAILNFLLDNPQYDFVVFLDADAIIHYNEIPFEWLFNRWGVTNETSLAMAADPAGWTPGNDDQDLEGRMYDNTGFVIARNIPRTHEIIRSWTSCPDNEIEYPDCAKFKAVWPAEQGAFGEYVRHKFNRPNDFQEIPCDEANGGPPPGMFDYCTGRFVRHPWLDKDRLKGDTNLSVMRVLMKQLHGHFQSMAGSIVTAGKTNITDVGNLEAQDTMG